MHDNGIPKKLIVLLILILTSALVWGDQKKTSAPPPSRPAPAKSAARPAANTARPMTNTGARPMTNTGVRPATNTGMRPMTNTGVRPTTNTGMRPMTNTGMRPMTNTSVRPMTNTGMRSTTNTGTANRPSTGMVNKPVTGMNNRPSTGMVNKPVTGMNNRPVTGMTNRPVAGTNRGIPGGPGTHSTMPTRTVSNVSLRGGGTAQVSRRANGRVAEVHANGMTIHQNVHGGRTIVVERNDRTIVTTGHGGYVQRHLHRPQRQDVLSADLRGTAGALMQGSTEGTTTTARVSTAMLLSLLPSRLLRLGLQSMGGAGLLQPGSLGLGWCALVWVLRWILHSLSGVRHGLILADRLPDRGQFAGCVPGEARPMRQRPTRLRVKRPAPTLRPPAEGAAEASAQTPLTPEVKQAIADEVQRQLAAEKAAAAAPQQAAPRPRPNRCRTRLNPAERVFVVASDLDVTVPASGQECSLTAGDVVMRLSDTPDANQTVTASIQSTKTADCPTGQTVAIGVQDLQEMHNQFQEQLDSGLKTLADKGGTGGLPKPPDTATTGGRSSSAGPGLRGRRHNLQAQQQQANQTVAQVSQNQ